MKELIKKIDNAYQLGLVDHFRSLRLERSAKGCDYKIVIRYNKNSSSTLSALCDEYGSDKGEIKTAGHPYSWPSHTHADYYCMLFDQRRDSICNVFECGIGTNNPSIASNMGERGRPGASLRVWRDYFMHAQITGADIDQSCLFDEDRIQTYYVDQTNPDSIRSLWDSVNVAAFDLMIDDGLHTYCAGVCLFENSIQKLGQNGIYVIEDVELEDMVKYQEYFADKDYHVEYVTLFRPDAVLVHNNLVVIRKLSAGSSAIQAQE